MDKQTTRSDVIAVFLFVLLGILVLLPAVVSRPRVQSRGWYCTSNLKQVGLAFRMWSNDHADRFPWSVNPPDGTATITPSLVEPSIGSVVDIYRAASNELVSPKVLACPSDPEKWKATAFGLVAGASGVMFTGKYLSYFAGIDADESNPKTILSGDRNIAGGGTSALRLWNDTNSIKAAWTKNIHNQQGNIGFGDGGAMQMTSGALQTNIFNALTSGVSQVRFLLPP